jgi:hypothetical protein
VRIAPALLLTALGGILADAVTADVPGIDVNALGAVLFFVGLLWLAVEVGVELAVRRPRRPRRAAPPPPPARREPARPYDPVIPPRADEHEAPTRRL